MAEQRKAPVPNGERAPINSVPNEYISLYLLRKAIPLASLRAATSARIQMRGEVLFRELLDAAGDHRGWERIWPDGEKKTAFGSTVRATFTPFGFRAGPDVLRLHGVLIVCAGLADGYRLHEATGLPVACGVGEPGLKALADCLFTCAPHVDLLVAADADEAGVRAAKATGRRWIVPGEVSHAA